MLSPCLVSVCDKMVWRKWNAKRSRKDAFDVPQIYAYDLKGFGSISDMLLGRLEDDVEL